ncbi:uncharacterized protein JN550_005205 [Neoarthrinium moseri]|uniref:uncharacterized protein n=1 Tax=Neoarthrinium moseri TaxID=1658444 RepID=UPI001FDADD35|nr:uncharacterized protein JN550_005205 [Neoarthrinium moseri]KAI1870662.1 hypothetical protein JN550_005205 [Neoarthrinium moseri]
MLLHSIALPDVLRAAALDMVASTCGSIFGLALLASMMLLLWRAWRFTINPLLHPDEPKELPYWIPFLVGRIHFGNTKEPFALTIAGSTTYVITNAQDVTEAYKNNSTLSWTEFLLEMMRTLGNNEICVEAAARPLPRDKDGFPNPHGKPLVTLARDMHIRQLHPGDQLDDLERRFLRWFERCLEPETMAKTYGSNVAQKDQDTTVTVSLVQWCSEIFTLASQEAYFGPELAHIDPHLHETFIVFDELSYQILYQYPRLLTGKMRAAKTQLQHAMKNYLQLPPSKRTDTAWFTDAFETECKALGIDETQVALMFFTVYWGANTNTRRAAYWLLAHLLDTPDLLAALRAETAAAFDQAGNLDPARLHDADHNRCFEAVWNETIRMSAYASSVRYITRDTIIGGKLLRRGHRLMIPYRQLHFDEDVFGPGVNEFRAARFGFDIAATDRKNYKENGAYQKLTRGDSWRPFGGGVTMCPGRFIARRSVHIFVALLLHRYDVESVGPSLCSEA